MAVHETLDSRTGEFKVPISTFLLFNESWKVELSSVSINHIYLTPRAKNGFSTIPSTIDALRVIGCFLRIGEMDLLTHYKGVDLLTH